MSVWAKEMEIIVQQMDCAQTLMEVLLVHVKMDILEMGLIVLVFFFSDYCSDLLNPNCNQNKQKMKCR